MMFAILSALSLRAWLRAGLAIVLALAIGWVVLELRQAAALPVQVEQLETQLEQERAAAELRDRINAAEAERLAAEQQERLTFGRLLDEAASDPGAAAPSLGVRSVTRLNAIR